MTSRRRPLRDRNADEAKRITTAQLQRENLIRDAVAQGYRLVGTHPATGKPVFLVPARRVINHVT